ncbi:hypothetical protein K3495_g7781 [Podosphaera aphanis]|nr:hypothetical protein K3495_g7781 [Podosphaera aphanis]
MCQNEKAAVQVPSDVYLNSEISIEGLTTFLVPGSAVFYLFMMRLSTDLSPIGPGQGIFVRVEFGVTYLNAVDFTSERSARNSVDEIYNSAVRTHARVTALMPPTRSVHFLLSGHALIPRNRTHKIHFKRPWMLKPPEYKLDYLHRSELELFQLATMTINHSSFENSARTQQDVNFNQSATRLGR